MPPPKGPKYKQNPEPRISANQLAEYLLASPVRRQSILRNAKYAPTVLVIRYKRAREAIGTFLGDDTRSKKHLHDATFNLKAQEAVAATPFEGDDCRLSGEAIGAFETAVTQNKLPELKAIRFSTPLAKLPPLKMGNGKVVVNVAIDLVARQAAKGDKADKIGAAIFQMSKAVSEASWRAEHSRNVATLCWILANKHLTGLGEIDRKLCLALDVFGQSATAAPTSYKRRLNDFEAACLEISALWPLIPPPADFVQP